jgi:hypothetical protein
MPSGPAGLQAADRPLTTLAMILERIDLLSGTVGNQLSRKIQ